MAQVQTRTKKGHKMYKFLPLFSESLPFSVTMYPTSFPSNGGLIDLGGLISMGKFLLRKYIMRAVSIVPYISVIGQSFLPHTTRTNERAWYTFAQTQRLWLRHGAGDERTSIAFSCSVGNQWYSAHQFRSQRWSVSPHQIAPQRA